MNWPQNAYKDVEFALKSHNAQILRREPRNWSEAASARAYFSSLLGRVNNQSFGANAQASCAKAMKLLRASLS